jgi:kynurenine formamidase
MVRHRNAVHAPSPRIAAADGFGAVHAPDLLSALVDDLEVLVPCRKLWGKDNARYNRGNPGIGIKAAELLIAKDPILLGADNTPVEVWPSPDPLLAFPVHQMALVVNGVHLLENLKLDELAAKNVSEFAFVMQPLKLKGATSSTVAPAAVR